MSGGSGGNFLDGHWNGNTDPIGNAIASSGGGQFDPLNLYAVNQPGGANYIAKNGTPLPGTLPNLGASSLIPKMAGGAFMPVNTAGGKFNAMANQAAGPLFNPAARPAAQPAPQTQAPSPEINALIQRFLSQGASRNPFMGVR